MQTFSTQSGVDTMLLTLPSLDELLTNSSHVITYKTALSWTSECADVKNCKKKLQMTA